MDVSTLPPLERIQYYLDLADGARREGARAAGSARESFRMYAERWERLAADTARQMRQGENTKAH
jgi:hypothetical protein